MALVGLPTYSPSFASVPSLPTSFLNPTVPAFGGSPSPYSPSWDSISHVSPPYGSPGPSYVVIAPSHRPSYIGPRRTYEEDEDAVTGIHGDDEDDEQEGIVVEDEDPDDIVYEIEELDEEIPELVHPRSSASYRGPPAPDTDPAAFEDTDPQRLFHLEASASEHGSTHDENGHAVTLSPITDNHASPSPSTNKVTSKPAKSSLGKLAEGITKIASFTLSTAGSVASATIGAAADAISGVGRYVDEHGGEFGDKLAEGIHDIGSKSAGIITNTGSAVATLAGGTSRVGLGATADAASWANKHGPGFAQGVASWVARDGQSETPTVEVLEGKRDYLKRKLGVGGATPPGTRYLTDDGREVVMRRRGSDGRRSMRTVDGEEILLAPDTARSPSTAPQRRTVATPLSSATSPVSDSAHAVQTEEAAKTGWFGRRSKSKDSKSSEGSKLRSKRGSRDSKRSKGSKRSGGSRQRSRNNSSSSQPATAPTPQSSSTGIT